MNGLRILYFNIKHIVGVKLLLLLVAVLLLPIAFAQLSIVSYIYYFEGIIPLVLQVLFVHTLIPDIKGQLIYERLSKMTDFRLYIMRYFSSLIISILVIGVVFVEYYILYFRTIDVNGFYTSNTAIYSEIGVINVLITALISTLLLSTVQIVFTLITNNKTSSLFLTIIFSIANMVFISFPLNYMSMFFKGDNWLPNKMVWMVSVVFFNGLIFIKNKYRGYIVQPQKY